MHSVYVLRSKRNGKRYIGQTSKIPSERLIEHNAGSNRWTRENGPFKIVHTESFSEKKKAIQREKFLKSGQGRKYLDSIRK